MTKKRSARSKVRADATAKAELIAKATYQRNRSTTEIIPADVTRAKAGAWLDLISPITEWAGLKGDQIRQKREALRIQQDDVLEEVSRRALRQLSSGLAPIKSTPTKFIVPFLEKASLEDINSELVDTWSSLLASAATNFNPHMVRFCSILSEIGPAEVKFLSRLCREGRNPRKKLSWILDAPMEFSSSEIVGRVNQIIDISKTVGENISKIIEEREIPGGILLVIGMDERGRDAGVDVAHDLDDDVWEGSISLLQSLGLVDHHILLSGEVERYVWYAETVSLTSFGVAFVSACDPEVREALI